MSPELGTTFLFGFLSLIVLFLGKRMGFFQSSLIDWKVPLRLIHLIGAFALYFLVAAIATKTATLFMKKEMMISYMSLASWLNFGVSFAIALFLAIYLKCLPREIGKQIIRSQEGSSSLKADAQNALYAWLLSFPLVLFLSKALELVVTQLFKVTTLPDQIAVRFLKSTFDSPLHFTLAVLSIIVFAPLIEETLFRGFLQTYVRQHLGARQAIVITSACFSLFHYAAGQGLGNIPIVGALFLLSLFLSFLYEKQRSLFAPMILHGSFNAVSVINLYLFGGITSGL